MTPQKQLVIATLAVLLTAGALFYLSPDAPEATNLKVGCVARGTIIARGQDWVDKNIPYNKTYDGYRTDCSGFVSMAWGLPRPGHTTETLGQVSSQIGKNELQSGDALLCAGTHVTLFVNWADGGKTSYVMMEEGNPSSGCVKKVAPYPFYDHQDCYRPMKYHDVC